MKTVFDKIRELYNVNKISTLDEDLPNVTSIINDKSVIISTLKEIPQSFKHTGSTDPQEMTIYPRHYNLYLVFDQLGNLKDDCFTGKCKLDKYDALAKIELASIPSKDSASYFPQYMVSWYMDCTIQFEKYITELVEESLSGNTYVNTIISYDNELQDYKKFSIPQEIQELLTSTNLEGGTKSIMKKEYSKVVSKEYRGFDSESYVTNGEERVDSLIKKFFK